MSDIKTIAIVVLSVAALILYVAMKNAQTDRDAARLERDALERFIRTVEPFTDEQQLRIDRAARRLEREHNEWREVLYGD